MNVQDVMTRSVCSCTICDSLSANARILWDNDCGCVPVTDETGRVVGMLTDRDICMAAYTQGRCLDDLRVDSAMSRELHAVAADDTLSFVQRKMQEQQLRRLPVVDADFRLVGLLALHDLACEAVRDPRRGRDGVSLEAVGQTLAAVSRPRKARPEPPPAALHVARAERPLAGAT